MRSALPRVEPRHEAGRVFRSEYSWQEQECHKGRPRLRHADGLPGINRAPGHPNRCGCSAYHAMTSRMYESWRASGMRFDEQVDARVALAMVRTWLPAIHTTRQLFEATAWQPFKVILEPCRRWTLYTNFGLILWARARAAGRLAPWESATVGARPAAARARFAGAQAAV